MTQKELNKLAVEAQIQKYLKTIHDLGKTPLCIYLNPKQAKLLGKSHYQGYRIEVVK